MSNSCFYTKRLPNPFNSKIKISLLFIACGTFSFTSYSKNFLCNQTWHLQLVYFFLSSHHHTVSKYIDIKRRNSFWSCWKMKGITVLRIVKICVSFQALILGFPLWVMPLLPSYQAVRSQRKLQSVVIKKNYKITTIMQWRFQPM